jgi:hypothetical protein
MSQDGLNEHKLIQLQKLDDRALWYGRQYWQVPLVFLGAVGVAVGQVIDKADAHHWLIPILGTLGGVAGLIIYRHMRMIDRNFARLVDDIIRLEKELGVRHPCKSKSATQPEGTPDDHRSPMRWLQVLTTASLFAWAFFNFCKAVNGG